MAADFAAVIAAVRAASFIFSSYASAICHSAPVCRRLCLGPPCFSLSANARSVSNCALNNFSRSLVCARSLRAWKARCTRATIRSVEKLKNVGEVESLEEGVGAAERLDGDAPAARPAESTPHERVLDCAAG